jgi:hypothetical protein
MRSPIVGLLVVGSALWAFAGTESTLNGAIKVGDNVQVSAANGQQVHEQPVVDADPDDPQHLIACSHIFGSEPDHIFASSVAYVSFDGGHSWQQSFRAEGIHPVCAFGHGGLAYLANLAWTPCSPGPCTYTTIGFYRSADGGRTWTKSPGYYHAGDHPYLSVDKFSQANRNAAFVSTMVPAEPYDDDNDWSAQPSGFALYRSDNEGRSFSAPVSAYSSHGHFMPVLGGTTVMADGTYVVTFPELMKSPFTHDLPPMTDKSAKNAWIKVAISRNGGKTLEHTATVATIGWELDPAIAASLKLGIAADTSSGPFQNRLYVTWQAKELRRYRIWLSHSDDMGKTWSGPVAVDDDPPNPSEGPNDFLPEIAVNDQGIVGLIWYDRRDNPDGLGWYTRFIASLDGGETFLPSARISSAPMSFAGRHITTREMLFSKSVSDAPTGIVGYSIGLAAGKDGAFHAVWTDNRTDVPQVWTSSITVSGKVLRNGSDELSALNDVSARVPIHIGNSYWDWTTGLFECDVFVKNVSSDPITGPLKLRVLRVDSTLGTIREVKIGERPVEAGSVIGIREDELKPGEFSKPVHVSARVNVIFGPHDQDIAERLERIFTLDLKVFAPPAAAKR